MGNSLLYFDTKTLWMHDIYLEPIIFFVSKNLSKKIEREEIDETHIEFFKAYNNDLINLFIGASDGALDLEFDLLNKNEYRLMIIRNALTSILSFFNSIDTNLSSDQFDTIGGFSFGIYANWDSPINTKDLAKKTEEILDFIS